MQARRLAAEELTPKLHHGWSSHKESHAHLGCPTRVRVSHTFPWGGILTQPWDPGMVGSRRKQWGGEVISGYSLTGEKCTVHEPSRPGSIEVCTGLLQFASWCESSSVYPLCLFFMYGTRSLAVTPHGHITLQHSKLWVCHLHAAHMAAISDKIFCGKNAQSWSVMIWELRDTESTLFLRDFHGSHWLVTAMIFSCISSNQNQLQNNQEFVKSNYNSKDVKCIKAGG